MTKEMEGLMVMVVGTVMVMMQTANATTIDMAASDLTTVQSMHTVEVNKDTTGNEGFRRGVSTQGNEGFSRGMSLGREERGCRRKNGQVR